MSGRLLQILSRAQARGFVGPGPVADHIHRALGLTAAVPSAPDAAVDLGTGAGIPGLPLALAWPSSRWLLVDSNRSRAAFVVAAVEELGLSGRVRMLPERAEVVGHGDLRGHADLVVARSFGRPAVTAECAAALLRVGGVLIVAEPPGGRPERWDPDGLAELGMKEGPSSASPTAYQVIWQVRLCPPRYPRRVGVPAKRPLF